ncbi:unnamed protein product, partial [Durusdinium trenchii]
VRTEGATRPLPASSVVASVPGTEESDLPKVEIWDPSADSGVSTTLKPKETSVTGHQLVVLLSLAAVAGAGILLMFPQLRSPNSHAPRRKEYRFDAREEEIGLVSAPGGFGFREDDIL